MNNFVFICRENMRLVGTKLHKRNNSPNHIMSALSNLRNIGAAYTTNYDLRSLTYFCLENLEYSSEGC